MAYIGAMTSTNTKGMHPVAHAHGIPHISPLATNPLLGKRQSFISLHIFLSPKYVPLFFAQLGYIETRIN
jgi:ABC-type branched-subunit amino acid transport system substrate-binding protein